MSENIKALSIIEDVNLQQVAATMQKISQFQAVVQKTLRQNHDYGVIPGTGDKPSLLKPGAEKILMLMGLSSEYELIERIQDYENGFFAFTVKCTLYRNGEKITEGLGHANSKERKYIKQDPFTLANTLLKMAKKRALVDATLTVASLSDVFSQDLEDLVDLNGTPIEPKQKFQNQQRKASEAQIKAIFGMGKKQGYNTEQLKEIVQSYGVESTKDLTMEQASEIITYLQNNPIQMVELEAEE